MSIMNCARLLVYYNYVNIIFFFFFFFFQAEDGIRDLTVTGVQTCALPIYAGAEVAQRAQRDTDAAALRVAQQRRRVGRPRDSDVDRDRWRGASERGAVLDDAHRREAELRDHVNAQPLLRGEAPLAGESFLQRRRRNPRMAFRVAGDADLADAGIGEHALLQDLQRVGVRTRGARLVAADEENAMHAVLARGALQELAQRLAPSAAPRGHVRHRVEAGVADRGDRFEHARDRQPR